MLPDIAPEVLQEDFEQIFDYIRHRLAIAFTDSESGPHAVFHWNEADKSPTPSAIRLASVMFPDATDWIAPCYSRIANQDYLDSLRGKSKKPRKRKLARFRAIYAYIIISVIIRLTPSTFHLVHHITAIDLSTTDWFEKTAITLDNSLTTERRYLPMSMVAPLLALIYTGEAIEDYDSMSLADRRTVAMRKGIFSIIPSLLLDKRTSRDSFEYVCFDYLRANVKVSESDYIRSASTSDIRRYDTDVEHPNRNTNMSSLQRLDKLSVGPPDHSASDQPLYLSLDSPLRNGEPDICFIAWIGGSPADTVGILDIQRAFLLSRAEPDICPGHGAPSQVINLGASLWGHDPYSKPTDSRFTIFIPVKGDHCRALFVAGRQYFKVAVLHFGAWSAPRTIL